MQFPGPASFDLNQWVPKCGSQTSSISIGITWHLLEMQILRSHPRATEPESLGGALLLVFSQVLQIILTRTKAWEPPGYAIP